MDQGRDPHHDEALEDIAPTAAEQDQEERRRAAVPAWIISLAAHGVALGLMALVIYASTPEVDEPAVRKVWLPPAEPRPDPERQRAPTPVEPAVVEVEAEAEPAHAVQSSLVEEAVDVAVAEDDAADAGAHRLADVTSAEAELGGMGAFMAIGAGGGATGAFANRVGGDKRRALVRGGGSRASESAVDAALRWLKRHQSPNGQWDVDGYPANCDDRLRCEPGTEHTGEDGDLACTGYAVLAFLGAGYDHRMPSRFRATVRQGVDWLLDAQKPDGLWGRRNYEHSIALLAIAEAYAMTNDPRLRQPTERGVAVLLERQAKDARSPYGLGWDYTAANANRNDGSVSGWAVMALKAATAGGIDTGSGMRGAEEWLERAWRATNPGFRPVDPYTDATTFPYVWNASNDAVQVRRGSDEKHDLAPVGALVAVFLGRKADDPLLNSLANHIMRHQFPTAYPTNTYYLYYNTLAMFQVGGERWERWNGTVRDLLVRAQRKGDGCFDGSWDYEGTKFHGHKTGRILSTAYCALSLQVYYRYLPVGMRK